MEKEVIIRPVKLSDAEMMYDLGNQLGHSMNLEEAKERLPEVMADKNQQIFVAQVDGSVLGYVNVVAFYEFLSGVQGRIWGLVVDERARGLGLGKALMAKAEEWANGRGSKTMKVNSNVKRIEAHKFYEKIGYEHYKDQALFRKDL